METLIGILLVTWAIAGVCFFFDTLAHTDTDLRYWKTLAFSVLCGPLAVFLAIIFMFASVYLTIEKRLPDYREKIADWLKK